MLPRPPIEVLLGASRKKPRRLGLSARPGGQLSAVPVASCSRRESIVPLTRLLPSFLVLLLALAASLSFQTTTSSGGNRSRVSPGAAGDDRSCTVARGRAGAGQVHAVELPKPAPSRPITPGEGGVKHEPQPPSGDLVDEDPKAPTATGSTVNCDGSIVYTLRCSIRLASMRSR